MQADARRAAGGDHLLALGGVQGHRFFDEDLLSGGGGEKRLRFVDVRRGGDVDRVHLRVGQQVLDRAVGSLRSVPPGENTNTIGLP